MPILQRVALDVLSHLLDVISPPPGVRPLAFITLPVPEQNAILGMWLSTFPSGRIVN